MRDFALDVLLTICLTALVCVFVSVLNARVGMLEWWLGDGEVRDRTCGCLSFIRARWFFFAAGGAFVATALALMYLLD